MAKAKKLPSGNYRTRIHIGNKKYKSFTAPTKKESEYIASLYLKNHILDRGNIYENTIYQIVSEFIVVREPYISPSTTRTYLYLLKHFIPLKTVRIKDFTTPRHQLWIDNIDRAPKTIKNINGLLVSALKHYGIELGPVNLPSKEYKPIKIPTTDEIKIIIDYFNERHDKDMILAIYLASMGTLRRGEVCALTSEDIDRNKSTIHINKSQVMDKNRNILIKEPKTYSSNRIIEMPKFVVDMMPKNNPIVNLNISQLTKRFMRAMKNLNMNYTFHSLRHYSASIMHANHIPTQYIMERGGWKTETTLNRIYRNSLDDYRKKYSKQTNNYFEDNFFSR